ncbi:PREDICTED: allantoicase-like [Branchiostoma belcheri]|uniref:Allantoate amidinohydrolase n=1 Tax=Branchiostoma belcheri TaxID=7741 RepID=A0A6P4ZJF5_BRABE|nr:PREDICTED: allantoicase-like [Branchiostoma belcheri]
MSSTTMSTTPPRFTQLNDLASAKAGGRVLFATDDWFAVADNLLKGDPPQWKEGVFTEYGKWMDGWESRRKRMEGHDWCIVQLGVSGVISGVEVDTSFFTGNYAPRFSLQAACLPDGTTFPVRQAQMGTAASPQQLAAMENMQTEKWTELVPLTALRPGYPDTCKNYYHITSTQRWTHVRLNMYPDGGIARLHVYGIGSKDWSTVKSNELVDLVAMENGGVCMGFSNAHYGHPRNAIGLGRAENMGDGWETARRLDRPPILQADKSGVLMVPGCEWAVYRLGHPGVILKVEIDTNHFKGNYPDSCRIEACALSAREEQALFGKEGAAIGSEEAKWKTLLGPTKLSAHRRLFLSGGQVQPVGVVTHVRLTMTPDGGISRMRLWGYPRAPNPAKL